MFDRDVPALLVNIDRFPLHHGMLGAVRSFGAAGVPVYAAVDDAWAPAGWSRHLAGVFLWRPDQNDEEQVLAGLLAIGERVGRPAVLVPTSDRAAIFIDDYSETLAGRFLFPRRRRGLARLLADKRELYRICRSLGLGCPKSLFPASAEEGRRMGRELGFPLLVKITEPWRRPRPPGLPGTAIVRKEHELAALLRLADTAPHLRVMLQEHIPSDGNRDAMFAAYCDRSSRCLVSFTGEKLRAYPADAGMTAASRATDDPALRERLETFLARLGYRGVVDLELRRDWRDGTCKLLDFNPRLGAQFRLYRSAAGLDVVQAMHLDLTGRAVPRAPQQRRSFAVENYELALFLKTPRTRRPRWREWLASLPGEREFAWFARGDIVPFLLMSLRVGVYRLFGRLWPAAMQRPLPTPVYRARRGRGNPPAPSFRGPAPL